jgi:hypothetical protein
MKRNFIIATTAVSLVVIAYSYLDDNERQDRTQEKSYSKYLYSKENIAKNIQASSRGPVTILNSTDNALRDVNEEIKTDVESYKELISENPKDIANNLAELEELHKKVVAWKRINHIKLDPLEEWSPRMVLTLSVLVGMEYKQVLKVQPDDFKISMKYWHVLKTFADSNDLLTMIRQEKLDPEFLREENLNKYYKKAPKKMFKVE